MCFAELIDNGLAAGLANLPEGSVTREKNQIRAQAVLILHAFEIGA
jgi:hypothetical protein